MTKNKIILVGGYCAAGKTTFAQNLSQKFNIPYFSKDVMEESVVDKSGRESAEMLDKGNDITFYCMLHIAEQLLQTGKICILESAFNPNEIEEIKILLEKYNCECLLFILKGDLDVMVDRYIERDKTGERHWIHKPAKEKHREWFKNLMLTAFGLEEIEIGQKIIVDTTSFDKVNYENLYNAAKEFIADSNIKYKGD